jgi:hypothetical protein
MRHERLHDDQWDRIEDTLPGRAGSVGVTAANNWIVSTRNLIKAACKRGVYKPDPKLT